MSTFSFSVIFCYSLHFLCSSFYSWFFRCFFRHLFLARFVALRSIVFLSSSALNFLSQLPINLYEPRRLRSVFLNYLKPKISWNFFSFVAANILKSASIVILRIRLVLIKLHSKKSLQKQPPELFFKEGCS